MRARVLSGCLVLLLLLPVVVADIPEPVHVLDDSLHMNRLDGRPATDIIDVAYSPDGSMFASADMVYVNVWRTDGELLFSTAMGEFSGHEIIDITWTTDSSKLIVAQVQPMSGLPSVTALKVADHTDKRIHTEEPVDGIRVQAVNSTQVIFSTADDNLVVYNINESGLQLEASVDLGGEVGCTAVDNTTSRVIVGLTDDSDHFVTLLNLDDLSILHSWSVDAPISDCAFNHNGAEVIWSLNDAIVQRQATDPYSFLSIIQTESSVIQFEEIFLDDEIIALTGTVGEQQWLESWNTINQQLNWRMQLGMQTHVFSLSADSSEIAFATNTGIIPIHHSIPHETGVAADGVDTDGDGIPDSLDNDDDGDMIPDSFDNTCAEGSDCSVNADLDNIRRIELDLSPNGTLTVKETITLPLEFSRDIRTISAVALTDDATTSFSEAGMMARQLCGPADLDSIAQEWIDIVRINGSVPWGAETSCEISEGLSGTSTLQNGVGWLSHVRMTWTTTLKIDPTRMVEPYDVRILQGLESRDGSILQSIDSRPAVVHIMVEGELRNSSTVWTMSDVLDLKVIPPEEPEPTLVGSFLDTLLQPLLIIPLIIAVGASIFLILKRRMTYEYELEEICEVCGSMNSPGALLCSDCGALFVYDQVMEKLELWMIDNEMSVRDLFNRFDEDGNGTLESDELVAGLRSLKIAALPVAQLEALVESLDEDGNGVIDFEEFEMAIGSVQTMQDDEDFDEELEIWNEEEVTSKAAPRRPPDQRQKTNEEPIQKKAPRAPPNQRQEVDEYSEPETSEPTRRRRVSRSSKRKVTKRVTRDVTMEEILEASDVNPDNSEFDNTDDDEDYDAALRRLTGSD